MNVSRKERYSLKEQPQCVQRRNNFKKSRTLNPETTRKGSKRKHCSFNLGAMSGRSFIWLNPFDEPDEEDFNFQNRESVHGA